MSTSIYRCLCLDCGADFNVSATIEEKETGGGDKFVCPKCKSKNIHQQFSAGNFIKNIFRHENKGGCGCGGGTCDSTSNSNDSQKNGCCQ